MTRGNAGRRKFSGGGCQELGHHRRWPSSHSLHGDMQLATRRGPRVHPTMRQRAAIERNTSSAALRAETADTISARGMTSLRRQSRSSGPNTAGDSSGRTVRPRASPQPQYDGTLGLGIDTFPHDIAKNRITIPTGFPRNASMGARQRWTSRTCPIGAEPFGERQRLDLRVVSP